MTSRWFFTPYIHTGKIMRPSLLKMALSSVGEALVVPPSERERILHQLHQFHQGITKAQLLTCGCIFWPGINKTNEEVVCQCEDLHLVASPKCYSPLTPMPTPSCPWQMCTLDIFTLEGTDCLICGDFYSKMILIQHLSSGQSNTAKGHLTAQGNVLGAWNPGSPLL